MKSTLLTLPSTFHYYIFFFATKSEPNSNKVSRYSTRTPTICLYWSSIHKEIIFCWKLSAMNRRYLATMHYWILEARLIVNGLEWFLTPHLCSTLEEHLHQRTAHFLLSQFMVIWSLVRVQSYQPYLRHFMRYVMVLIIWCCKFMQHGLKVFV